MNEAELLFTQILGCDRVSLYQNRKLSLDKDKSACILNVFKRRITGEPIQYILGKTEFMGLEFKVNNTVLIPRPETEILVEKTAEIAGKLRHTPRILDLGTGSGCISISLAKILPHCRIDATDISRDALSIARYNAGLHKVKVNFMHSDLFNSSNLRPNSYDLIISNPPYIPRLQLRSLEVELGYEPVIALDGGGDGLNFYRRIASGASLYLKEGGFLIMEIGYNQAGAIKNIFQNRADFEIIEIIKDYSNLDRVAVAQKEG